MKPTLYIETTVSYLTARNSGTEKNRKKGLDRINRMDRMLPVGKEQRDRKKFGQN